MQNIPTKPVFVSHASADRVIVNSFFKDVLTEYLGVPKDKILYTSQEHNNTSTLDKNAIEEYVSQLVTNLQKCDLFVVILTHNYIDSQACQNELGAAFVLNKKIYVFKDSRLDDNHEQYYLRNRLGSEFNKAGIRDFLDYIIKHNLSSSLTSAKNLNDVSLDKAALGNASSELEKSYKKYKKGSDPVIEKTSKTIIQAIIKRTIFHEANPIILFGNRKFYVNLSIEISRCAKEKLIWTIYKSPLLVEAAYRDTELLTEYDRQFSKFDVEKTRLVIFQNREEARSYETCNVSYHRKNFPAQKLKRKLTKELLEKRKKAFEENIDKYDGVLYFTTVERITEKLKTVERVKGLFENISKNASLDYEFGFIVNGQRKGENLGFTTGFNSKSYDTETDADTIKHLAFYSERFPSFTKEQLEKENRYKLIADIMCQLAIVENVLDPHHWENEVFFKKANFNELVR